MAGMVIFIFWGDDISFVKLIKDKRQFPFIETAF